MAKVTTDKVKNVFLLKLTFFETYIKIKSISVENNGLVRVILLHVDAFFVHFDKLIRRPPGPLWGGTLLREKIL